MDPRSLDKEYSASYSSRRTNFIQELIRRHTFKEHNKSQQGVNVLSGGV
jgi:hypothetical protein